MQFTNEQVDKIIKMVEDAVFVIPYDPHEKGVYSSVAYHFEKGFGDVTFFIDVHKSNYRKDDVIFDNYRTHYEITILVDKRDEDGEGEYDCYDISLDIKNEQFARIISAIERRLDEEGSTRQKTKEETEKERTKHENELAEDKMKGFVEELDKIE